METLLAGLVAPAVELEVVGLEELDELIDVGCELIDVGCELIDVGCELIDVGSELIDVGCELVDVGCELIDVGCDISLAEPAITRKLPNPPNADGLKSETPQHPPGGAYPS